MPEPVQGKQQDDQKQGLVGRKRIGDCHLSLLVVATVKSSPGVTGGNQREKRNKYGS